MNSKGQGEGVAIILILLFLLGLVAYFTCFDVVDASHIGIKNQFGVIKGTMEPGMQFTGPFVEVVPYNLRTRKMVVTMMGDEGAVDRDGQSVFANIEVNYRFRKDKVIEAYKNVGRDGELEEILNVEGIIKEGFKSITTEYASLELFQKRSEVKQKAIDKIMTNFPTDYFIVENVVISNIDFNDAFKKAIEDKKVAEERAKATEQEVNIAKFEANKKIETARGEMESKKLRVDADAYETLKIAESEAKALELKAKELTPMMVQNNYIDQWDGKLPQYVLGDSSILLSMPMGGNGV